MIRKFNRNGKKNESEKSGASRKMSRKQGKRGGTDLPALREEKQSQKKKKKKKNTEKTRFESGKITPRTRCAPTRAGGGQMGQSR